MRIGAVSHVGKVRSNNEDAYLIKLPLLAVADGMGGHDAGEVASAAALDALRTYEFRDGDVTVQLKKAVQAAHDRVSAAVAAAPTLSQMGTTLTAALLTDEKFYVAHVGDSRAYVGRDGQLRLLTADHSVAAELLRAGQIDEEAAREHPGRHVLTRAVSAGHNPEVDIIVTERRPGDALLLCTDGLIAHVGDEEIAEALQTIDDAEEAARALVKLALERGGTDNVTVVIARAKGAGET